MVCLAILLGAPAACSGSDEASRISGDRTLAGDTVVFTFTGTPDTLAMDSPRVLWRSDRIRQPAAMALANGSGASRLVVGDGERVHILRLYGDTAVGATSVGREGAGPGEFRNVVAVGALSPGTLMAWDRGNARLTFFRYDGEYVATRPLAARGGFRPGFFQRPLRVVDGDLLDVASDGPVEGSRSSVALVRRALTGDRAAVVEKWPGDESQLVSESFVAATRLFSDATKVALGPDGRVARGDGQAYCITVFRAGDPAPPRRLCRRWERTPVGEGIRSPDWDRIENPRQRQTFQAVHAATEIGDRLPSYDRLLWSEQGRLWVRTLGPEMADVHPHFVAMGLDDGPPYRYWDVFDPDEGSLLCTVRLPTAFRLEAVSDGVAYGFYELPTGEVAIGRAHDWCGAVA